VTAVPLLEAAAEARFGGKAARLSEALRAGLPVPHGVALESDAVDRLVAAHAPTREEVLALPARLGGAVAARSSAVGEDSTGASFAGQHATLLNVTTGEALAAAIARIHASAHAAGALAYRQRLGITGEPRIGVVVQRMIEPECAGVLFTVDPLTGDDAVVIEAAWGLGEAVVAGTVTPDRYRLARAGTVLERTAGDKDLAILAQPGGGTSETSVPPARAAQLCLGDARLAALHDLAMRCERVFGPRLDLEWAFTEGALYLLQWRPVTSAAAR
jgi:pyruvate, water dikinase